MIFSKSLNLYALLALTATSLQAIGGTSSFASESPECSKQDFQSEKEKHANLMKQGSFAPVAAALSDAVKAGFKGKTVKINIKYDRSGKVIDATLDEPTGYSSLDAAVVNFGKEMEVTKGLCGTGSIPIVLSAER